MIEQDIVEMIKFSPVLGALVYIIAIMGRALADRDKRINELIDRCINPCKKDENVDNDNI